MSRVIKFRAYDKVKKQIAQVWKLDLQGAYSEPRNVFLNNGGNTRHQGDFELMQYTGLEDKNGQEIYEGDIVELEPFGYDKDSKNPQQQKSRVVVKYEITTFGKDARWSHTQVSWSKCEVIGNIYENPELLEEIEV